MKKLSLISVICCLCIFFIGCKKEFDSHSEQNVRSNKSGTNVNENGLNFDGEPWDEIILGNQLVNAYSVANMRIAYDSLVVNSKSNLFSPATLIHNLTIETTHLYICLKPKDSTEYDYLIEKSGLTLFPYPLDYEIIQQGLVYNRPGANKGDLPWFYTTVPVEQAGKIEMDYEVLEKCYIPSELVSVEARNNSAFTETMAMLELEALWQTKNITQDEYDHAVSAKGAKYPTGYIKVKNTTTGNYEGVKKMKVRVHNIIKWCEAYTDENGYYKMSKSYLTKIHYAAIYENQTGFKIWGNWAFLAPANFCMGWNSNSGHSKNFDTNSKGWLWSTVNNAAYIYREKMCPAFNITKPASDLRLWTVRLSGGWLGSAPMAKRAPIQAAVFNTFVSIFGITSLLSYIAFVLPDIFIIKDFTNTKECYSTVFHEMAHASHYAKAGSGYWLNYIAGIVANLGYGNVNGTNAGYIGVGEMWGEYMEWRCMTNNTVLGYSFNNVSIPGTSYWFKPRILYDLQMNCSLTPKQIYDCLESNVTNHAQLKAKLIQKYGNSSGINAVFASHGF
ncbi:MAG: hypothetical protein FWC41_01155 [Firmicutes bacterium]|nr:hypothetical protein [Bacillota bacterium]